MQVHCKTWARDSHGLFDYENDQVKTTTISFNQNGTLVRKKNNVLFLSEHATEEERNLVLSGLDDPEHQTTLLGNFVNGDSSQSNFFQ